MRDSRNRWVFFSHPTKPPLTAAEVTYWKKQKGIMKVGMEFEFNLPEQVGTCRGDNIACPCVNIANDVCWQVCKNEKACKSVANINRCCNRTDKCKPENCSSCGNYSFCCAGIYCLDFASACLGCDDFKVECDSCPEKYDPDKNPDAIRKRVTKELKPNNCYGAVSGIGVHSIVEDGSLLGNRGMEVVTVGRRVDYWEFYKMAGTILDSAVKKGAYVNERCSTHMHLLTSYYGKVNSSKVLDHTTQIPGIPNNINELEKEMPEIILANFHQLCRRYQNTMTWMTMALDEPERMTRWEKFRASILHVSAILNDMKTVRSRVYEAANNTKYGWVNYNNTTFGPGGNVKTFHVEMRVADGILSQSAVAALGCLYYALFVKAVEISRYGVLEVGDDEWMKQALEIKKSMLNNFPGAGEFGNNRFGDTTKVMEYADILRREGFELIRQLKHILIKFGPSYHILEKLVERPIALRRCDGETWEMIEDDLKVIQTEEGIFETKMAEFIDLRLIDECKDPEEWIRAVECF